MEPEEDGQAMSEQGEAMSDTEATDEVRELDALAEQLTAAVRPIMAPVFKRFVVAVLLSEVDVVHDVPSAGLSSFSFGNHCVLGNVPESALPPFLRFIADSEDTGAPVLVKRVNLRKGPQS